METYLYFVTYDLVVPDDEESRNYRQLGEILSELDDPERIVLGSDDFGGAVLRGIRVAKSCWFVKTNLASADSLKEIIMESFDDETDEEIMPKNDTLIVAEIKWGNISLEGPRKQSVASADDILDWLGMLNF